MFDQNCYYFLAAVTPTRLRRAGKPTTKRDRLRRADKPTTKRDRLRRADKPGVGEGGMDGLDGWIGLID